MRDTRIKLSSTTVVLHWLVGVLIISLLCVGLYMAETETLALYPIHKSFGFLVLLLALGRSLWRLNSGWPEPVRVYPQIERMLSRAVHWTLIVASMLMPVSGVMMSVGGGYGLIVFGWTLVARTPSADDPTKMIPLNETVAEVGHEMHEILAWVLILTVLLHICGAFKHHFRDKDSTLSRMLGRSSQQ